MDLEKACDNTNIEELKEFLFYMYGMKSIVVLAPAGNVWE